jgi:NDP-sugar pyrophosphorylase family protein
MKEALQKLKKEVCSIKSPQNIEQHKIDDLTKNTQVALMAGGAGTRFREIVETEETNKNAHELPNGETMIERVVKMYRDAGIKDFIALVYHGADSIVETLGNGEKLGVNVKYSYDPDRPVGKGGAVLNALQNGSINKEKHLIVHNPDDVITSFQEKFVNHIIKGHIEGLQKEMEATIVVVEKTPYSYTGMEIKENVVEDIEMYPLIPIPTHIGVTIFSPNSYEYFPKYFDLTKKADFEKVLFPVLSEKKKLYAVSIPNTSWIAVNKLKAYKKFVEYLQQKN